MNTQNAAVHPGDVSTLAEYYHKIKGISVINENNARKIEMSNNPRYGNDPRLTMFHINFPIFKNIENQERFFTWLYELRDNIDSFRYWTLDHYRTLATEAKQTQQPFGQIFVYFRAHNTCVTCKPHMCAKSHTYENNTHHICVTFMTKKIKILMSHMCDIRDKHLFFLTHM